MKLLVPILRESINYTRLEVIPVGTGTFNDGFISVGGPPATHADVHLLCAQPWTTSGRFPIDYESFLDYVECLADRVDPTSDNLDECAEYAGIYNEISNCLSLHSNEAWKALEESYTFAKSQGVSRSPSTELYWPPSVDGGLDSSEFCAEVSTENMRGAICSAGVMLDASTAGSPFSDESLTKASTLLFVFSSYCGDSPQSQCEDIVAISPIAVLLFYILPLAVILLLFFMAVKHLRRRLQMLGQMEGGLVSPNGSRRRSRWSSPSRDDAIAAESRLLELRRLPTALVDTDDASCTICLDEVAGGERIYKLSCGHVFHRKCLMGWIAHKDECPVCRKVVLKSDSSDLNAVSVKRRQDSDLIIDSDEEEPEGASEPAEV
eukprot:g50.t1